MKKIILTIVGCLFAIGTLLAQKKTKVYKELSEKYDRVEYIKDEGFSYYEVSNTPSAHNMRIFGIYEESGKEIISTDLAFWVVSYDSKNALLKCFRTLHIRIINEENGIDIDTSALFYSFFDKKGKQIIEACSRMSYDTANQWYNIDFLQYVGIVDKLGKEIVSPTENFYYDIFYDKTEKLFIASNENGTYMLDSNQNVLTTFPIKGHRYYRCSSIGDRCYKLQTDIGPEYIIATSGFILSAEAINNGKYTYIYEAKASEGLLCYQDNGLFGYIDIQTGDVVIKPQYTSAESFKNGIAKVSKGSESFLISNPLKSDGEVLSYLSVTQGERSDIDNNIPQTNQKQENTFAVIVANQNYNNFVCPYAINDGKIFKEYCLKTLGIPERNISYFEDATLNNIHSAMSRIKDLAEVYEGDAKIIFYYVGQGITDDNKQAYIMPSDASINLINSTGYSLKSLYNELGDLTVQSAVVLLDAGFNNEDRTGKNIGKNRGVAIKNKEEQIKGKIISISAASSGETALQYKDKSHGLFTYYLCKKLQETKGNVNIEDLSNYIISNVSQTSLFNNKKKQTPNVNKSKSINLKSEKL